MYGIVLGDHHYSNSCLQMQAQKPDVLQKEEVKRRDMLEARMGKRIGEANP